MKPSQISSQLRRIAAKLERSNRPSRKLVARDLKKILVAASEPSSGATIIIHIHGDHEQYDVTQSSSISSNKPFDRLTLPKGDIIIVAKSLDDIKANMDMTKDALLDALYDYGLLDADDDGNYIL